MKTIRQVPAATAEPYNPNSEQNQPETLAAHFWELLRRNHEFQEVADQWTRDPEFRHKHACSEDYQNFQTHFPRCALDWMLSPKERVKLAIFQIEKGLWFLDGRYNFGPVTAEFNGRPPSIQLPTLLKHVVPGPMKKAPVPLRLDQPWPKTPRPFRQQFTLAIRGDVEFQVVTDQLLNAGEFLRWAAARFERNDTPKKTPEIIRDLDSLGQWFRDLANMYKLFGIPNADCSPGALDKYLANIRDFFARNGMLKRGYSAHASWLGTADAWRWFLQAERRGLKANNRDMYLLARDYVEDLKRKRIEGATARKAVKDHGNPGDVVKGPVLANRRKTLTGFIKQIESWRDEIYPPSRWFKFTQRAS